MNGRKADGRVCLILDGEGICLFVSRLRKAYVDDSRRSFHDLETFKGVRVLSVERMLIDVEICGQLLIARRRKEHLENVAGCIKVRC
jgi:hypothetical protein